MNSVCLIGRITADPEVLQTASGTVILNFSIAVDRGDKDKTTDFIRCVAFGKTAEFIDDYIGKGTRMGVTGRIQTGSYTNKDGQKVYTTDVIVERVDFADGLRDEPEEEKTRGRSNDNRGRRR